MQSKWYAMNPITSLLSIVHCACLNHVGYRNTQDISFNVRSWIDPTTLPLRRDITLVGRAQYPAPLENINIRIEI